MGLIIAGEQYFADLDYEEYSREQLYEWVKDPNVTITTSLVSAQEYTEKCEKYLEKGMDILYIACTDALSGSRGVFELVKKDLEEKYPDRIILSINSCRAEMALGLMCLEAAKLRDEGKNIEDVYPLPFCKSKIYCAGIVRFRVMSIAMIGAAYVMSRMAMFFRILIMLHVGHRGWRFWI